MATTNKRNKGRAVDDSTDAPSEPKTVMVDYDGVIARAPGQDEIRHVNSPFIYPWPEQGRGSLVLQPGLNILDAAHWGFYADKPQVAWLLSRGEVTVLTELPRKESDLKDLISRSCSEPALETLREAVKAGGEELFDADYLTDRGPSLLRTIEKRLSSTNRIDFPSTPYHIRDIKAGPSRATGMGMGG